ncbi:hypothetical protein D3C78_1662460 [compost metagenome]
MPLMIQIFRLAFDMKTAFQNTCDRQPFVDRPLHRFPDALEEIPDLYAFTLLDVIA